MLTETWSPSTISCLSTAPSSHPRLHSNHPDSQWRSGARKAPTCPAFKSLPPRVSIPQNPHVTRYYSGSQRRTLVFLPNLKRSPEAAGPASWRRSMPNTRRYIHRSKARKRVRYRRIIIYLPEFSGKWTFSTVINTRASPVSRLQTHKLLRLKFLIPM